MSPTQPPEGQAPPGEAPPIDREPRAPRQGRDLDALLRESEQRFRLALRNAPVSVAVQDRELRYVWAYNQRTARPDEIIGKLDSEILTAEEAARVGEIKRRVLERGVEHREQLWLDRPGGPIFLDVYLEPVRDEEGRVVGVGSATVDLTPMKLAERALRESEERAHARAAQLEAVLAERKKAEEELALVTRLYAVLTRTNELIVRTRDEETLYEEVCRIVAEEGGFPLVWVGLVSGRRVAPVASWGEATAYLRDVVVEVDGTLGQGPAGTCVRENRVVVVEDFDSSPTTGPWHEAIQRHGLRASAAFPLRREGAAIGALTFYAARSGAFTEEQLRLLDSLCADLSYALDALHQERLRAEAERALREREQALRDADRRKTEFLAVLSHELRNPLAPIRNSVFLLERLAPGTEGATRAREVIRRQSEHLTRLVDDLLDVTRISRGKIALQRERLDLREIVRRTADDLSSLYEASGIELLLEHAVGPVWVDADATRISQVLGNLLHNAAKFTPAGGHVWLRVAAGDGRAELRVRDDGLGIDPGELERMFEPFAQAQQSLARTKGGLGLGLALVKGLVELHGGTVEARSAGAGQGAELVVALPLSSATGVADRGRGGASAPEGRDVLVIEDNVDAGQSLADVLGLLGHRVRVTRDGRSGVALARELRPHVVLCDIGLPDIDGYEVARTLRADGALQETRLVALSGYAQPEDRRRARDAGFDAHVAKPPDLDELLGVLASEG